jgi:hypothetical protein
MPDQLGGAVQFALPVPAGWATRPPHVTTWRPTAPEAADMLATGFGSCLDDCRAAASKLAFGIAADPRPGMVTVLSDVQKPLRRDMTLRSGPDYLALAAWWNDGGSRYYTCSSGIVEADLLPAFACACASVNAVEVR